MAKSKANGTEPKQEIIPADKAFYGFDRLSAAEREQFMKAYVAGAGAAAAVQAQEMDLNVKEFYGHSPTDLRREFTTLPRPAHGGSRRPSQRINPNGHTGPSTRQ
jgi:hypothetical protein